MSASPADPYAAWKVATFAHWDAFVHPHQQYLGRCYLWCRRPDALDLAEATPAEVTDLHAALATLRQACAQLFAPDWFNYAFLGNEAAHLHGHLIPRYATPKVFLGHRFADERYGHNYRTDPAFATPPGVAEAVIQSYRTALAR